MTSPEPLTHLDHEQRRTLERLTGHPLARNVKWHEVTALLEAVGDVTVESKDRYRVTIAGRTEVFRPPAHQSDVPADVVMKLRHLLTPASPGPAGNGG